MKKQVILSATTFETELHKLLDDTQESRIFLVCGHSFEQQWVWPVLNACKHLSVFQAFEPNPSYESVVTGVRKFNEEQCNIIIAAGGGSAIDVAKCIKLFSNMDSTKSYLEQTIVANEIPFIAIPTTAGTGSETTSFAVIYQNGKKESVDHESSIPDYVLMDGTLLNSLPLYQKKVTMLDALCHGLESYWSVHSTTDSTSYSIEAIKGVMKNYKGYLENDEAGNEAMLYAAHAAGKAINIAKTTAAHAMCYKMTKLYNIPHGYSAMLCLIPLWEYMYGHMERCVDQRGKEYLMKRFTEIAELLGCTSVDEAVVVLKNMLSELSLCSEKRIAIEDIQVLIENVNADRLGNNPILLDEKAIQGIYETIIM